MEVAGGVEDEFAEEFSGVAFDDADVQVVDEQGDGGCGEASAEADVVQATVVPQGDGAAGVDPVVSDAPVRVEVGPGCGGLGARRVGVHGGSAVECPVGAGVVVVTDRKSVV